jgi:hypothetical protein
VKDFLVVLIVRLNMNIGNYIHHNLVTIVVKHRKCVLLVVGRFEQLET